VARQDQQEWKLVVDGVDCGIWDAKTGGDVDSTEVKFRRGGRAGETSLGGPQTTSEVVLTRLNDLDAGDPALRKWLYARAGKARCKAIGLQLDRAGVASGEPETVNGSLKMVTSPPYDANASEASTWSVTISPEGIPA